MSDLRDLPEDDRLLAAEYVLGLVEPAEWPVLARRVEAEPAFAGAVAEWENRFAPLAAEVADVTPPAALWLRIQAALGSIPVSAAQAEAPKGLWHSLNLWRALGLSGYGLAIASLAALFIVARPQPPMSEMVAVMSGDGRVAFTAMLDRSSGRLTLIPAANMPVAAGQTHELWLVEAGSNPRSLGTFSASAPMAMPVPRTMGRAIGPGAALAISVEPMGGSPTGQPTGAVVASGPLNAI